MSGCETKVNGRRNFLGHVSGTHEEEYGFYTFSAKVADNPTDSGFPTPENEDGGRVLKLSVKHNDEVVYEYERGEVTLGIGVDEEEALDVVLPIVMTLDASAKAGTI